HSGEHVGGLDLAGGTGRAGRDGNPLEIERDDGGFGLHPRHREQRGIGQPIGRGAKNHDLGRGGLEAGFEPLAQRRHARALRGKPVAGRRGCRAEARDGGHVLGAGAHVALLAAALDERIQAAKRRPRNERAHTLGGADLVPGQGQKISAEDFDITGNSTHGLDRVDVQEPARRMHHGRAPPPHGPGRGPGKLVRPPRARWGGATAPRAPPPPPAARPRPTAPPPSPPPAATGTRSTAAAGNRPPASTEGCSIAETKSLSRAVASIAGASANMLASVPPEVNTTLRGSAPTSAATLSRACSIRRRAARPSTWTEDGCP